MDDYRSGCGALVRNRPRSLALVGFGLDSGIETVPAVVLFHRWRADVADSTSAAGLEQRALRIIGITFVLLAAYIGYEGLSDLIHRSQPKSTAGGIVVSAVALLVMLLLGRAKRRVGRLLESGALLADSVETFVCAYLSAIVLVGLILNGL